MANVLLLDQQARLGISDTVALSSGGAGGNNPRLYSPAGVLIRPACGRLDPVHPGRLRAGMLTSTSCGRSSLGSDLGEDPSD